MVLLMRNKAILFDLDGTLLDTAPDLGMTLNCLRQEHGLAPLSFNVIRPIANLGSKALLKLAFDLDESHPKFETIRQQFFELYQQHLANHTQFFPGIDKVLSYIESRSIPWGIVTNKLTRHTHPLLAALDFKHHPGCIICGDTLPTHKPDPGPILHACELLNADPASSCYIGDAHTDVMASKAAGTQSLVALYGYINTEDPYSWQADEYFSHPIDILEWLMKT